jgi:hypothetical protein
MATAVVAPWVARPLYASLHSPPETLSSPAHSSLSLIFLVLWRRADERSSRRQGERSRQFEGEDPAEEERIRWRWGGMDPAEF